MTKDLFAENGLDNFLGENYSRVKVQIEMYSEQHFVELDLEDEANRLCELYRVKPINLRKEETKVTVEKERTSNYGRIVELDLAIYHIPFEGDGILFGLRPNHFYSRTCAYEIINSNLVLRIQSGGIMEHSQQTQDRVKNEFLRIVQFIEQNLSNQAAQLSNYHLEMKNIVLGYLEERKRKVETASTIKRNINPFA